MTEGSCLSFVMIAHAGYEITAFHKFRLFIHVNSNWCNVVCVLVNFARAVFDGKAPMLTFVIQHEHP